MSYLNALIAANSPCAAATLLTSAAGSVRPYRNPAGVDGAWRTNIIEKLVSGMVFISFVNSSQYVISSGKYSGYANLDLGMTVTLVLGGARSGKSSFAEKLVLQQSGPRAYIATAQARDEEMAERIVRHQSDRGPDWTTFEVPLKVSQTIRQASEKHSVILLDCLTLWLSNLMEAGLDIDRATEDLIATMCDCNSDIVLVSNEVGLGIVPVNALARAYRDASGRMNMRVAEAADQVYFLAAGLPLQMKGQADAR